MKKFIWIETWTDKIEILWVQEKENFLKYIFNDVKGIDPSMIIIIDNNQDSIRVGEIMNWGIRYAVYDVKVISDKDSKNETIDLSIYIGEEQRQEFTIPYSKEKGVGNLNKDNKKNTSNIDLFNGIFTKNTELQDAKIPENKDGFKGYGNK